MIVVIPLIGFQLGCTLKQFEEAVIETAKTRGREIVKKNGRSTSVALHTMNTGQKTDEFTQILVNKIT